MKKVITGICMCLLLIGTAQLYAQQPVTISAPEEINASARSFQPINEVEIDLGGGLCSIIDVNQDGMINAKTDTDEADIFVSVSKDGTTNGGEINDEHIAWLNEIYYGEKISKDDERYIEHFEDTALEAAAEDLSGYAWNIDLHYRNYGLNVLAVNDRNPDGEIGIGDFCNVSYNGDILSYEIDAKIYGEWLENYDSNQDQKIDAEELRQGNMESTGLVWRVDFIPLNLNQYDEVTDYSMAYDNQRGVEDAVLRRDLEEYDEDGNLKYDVYAKTGLYNGIPYDISADEFYPDGTLRSEALLNTNVYSNYYNNEISHIREDYTNRIYDGYDLQLLAREVYDASGILMNKQIMSVKDDYYSMNGIEVNIQWASHRNYDFDEGGNALSLRNSPYTNAEVFFRTVDDNEIIKKVNLWNMVG